MSPVADWSARAVGIVQVVDDPAEENLDEQSEGNGICELSVDVIWALAVENLSKNKTYDEEEARAKNLNGPMDPDPVMEGAEEGGNDDSGGHGNAPGEEHEGAVRIDKDVVVA